MIRTVRFKFPINKYMLKGWGNSVDVVCEWREMRYSIVVQGGVHICKIRI